MTPDELTALADKADALYDRLKLNPEAGRTDAGDFVMRPDAFLALLDLRFVLPELVREVRWLARERGG